MTSFRFLAIVLVLAAGSLQAQVSGTRVQPQARAETVAPSVLLQQYFRANDATPDGWQQVGQATLDYGLFFGTRTQAESFAVGMEQVFSNPAMLRAQLPGNSVILPPAQLVLKGRLLAPPLIPLQIVTILLPKLADGPRGAIQNLRVTYTIPVNMSYGYNGIPAVDVLRLSFRYLMWSDLCCHGGTRSQYVQSRHFAEYPKPPLFEIIETNKAFGNTRFRETA
jgi:hypothetical protein